jgi:outer membrane protein assembly factor BamB
MRGTVLTLALSLSGCALAGCALAGCARPAGPAAASPVASRPVASRPVASRPVASAGAAALRPGPPVTAQDWPTYHRTAARTGDAPGTPAAGRLAVAWTRHLDGAVYGQPLVIGNLVIAATEGDSVYGLDRATGQVRWRVQVGTPVPLSELPCGDIDPLGITGTPVYDPATGLVYVVAETTGYHHVLFGVSVTSGRVEVRRDVPTPDGHPANDQQRAALALAAGRVYVAFGGLEGDCGPYRGSVVGVPVTGQGPLVSYRVPTSREAGIWATAGPLVGPRGMIYVSVGNGAATSPPFDASDSVTALSPGLRRVGLFAPSTWANDNANDLDLGSSGPALLSNGTLLADGKRGIAYLLDAARLGGVGGQRAQAPVCHAYGGMATAGTIVYLPCSSGTAAVDTAGGHIHVRWHGPAAATGSPVTGGGAVWVPDVDGGVLYELSAATGKIRQHISLGSPLPHFASPSLSGSLVLVGTMNGVAAVRGA